MNKNDLIRFKVEKFPKKPEGFLKIGRVEEKLGNFGEAEKNYEKALLLEPENITTVHMLKIDTQ